MAVWRIRVGTESDREDLALREGLALLACPELPDLSPVASREELRSLYQKQFPEATPRRTQSGTRQVWAFRGEIQEGDLVVMPMSSRRLLALGEVAGPYRYRPDLPLPARHTRPVRWRRSNLSYDDLGSDLRRLTATGQMVCRLRRPEAEERLSALMSEAAPAYPLSACAEDTGFLEAELARWVRAIHRKGQAVLYGPPGTGKTFLAEKLAAHLVGGGDGFVQLVQFHPATTYQSFMQGETEGLLPRFCRRAATRSGTSVLIIDELNRAEPARVFGELLYLLEHRDRPIPLTGGGELTVPGRVRLLATMSTALRSPALTDPGLRRRFAFLQLEPRPHLLQSYHERQETGFEPDGLIKVLSALNRAIGDPRFSFGVTPFLRDDLAAHLEDIWRMEVEPFLEEHFLARPDLVERFRWSQVRGRLGT